jgi:pimeloyl-ACP methyl ester carboxylesterase
MTETETETVQSADGTAIVLERTGRGAPLVMVSAAGTFRGMDPMATLAERLAEHFTVIRYDRRGRGESGDTLPYSVAREVEDLEAILQAAGGPALVFGFSSGAAVALHGAAAGLPITKLVLLEPPIELAERSADDAAFRDELVALVEAGRRGDAYEHFNRSIGVPEEFLDGMRAAPFWTALEALAHTLVYDVDVTSTLSAEQLRAVTTDTLVINSAGSDDQLAGWARAIGDALPNATHRVLDGEWHDVAAADLAPVVVQFGEPA